MFCRRCGKYNLPYAGVCTRCGAEIYSSYTEFWNGKPLRYLVLLPIFVFICFYIWIYYPKGFSYLDLKLFIVIIITGILLGHYCKNYMFKDITGNTYVLKSMFKRSKEIRLGLMIGFLIGCYSILKPFLGNKVIDISDIIDFYLISSGIIALTVPYIFLLIYERKNGTVIMRKEK